MISKKWDFWILEKVRRTGAAGKRPQPVAECAFTFINGKTLKVWKASVLKRRPGKYRELYLPQIKKEFR